MRIGRGVRIGYGTILRCRTVEMDDGASIGHLCLVRADALRMGKRSALFNLVRLSVHTAQLRSQSVICSQNEIAGDVDDPQSSIYLGPATWILPHCYVNVARPIHLGRNVGVGGGSYLFTHGMWLSKLDGYPVSYGGITIDDDVWLPWGCFILPNVSIGKGVVVGARSVVNKSLPNGVLAAGVPAKVIREKSNADLTDDEKLEVLAEVSQLLATRRREPLRIERSATVHRHFIAEELTLVVHVNSTGPLAAGPALNVVFTRLPDGLPVDASVWSLANYHSTAFDRLSPQSRRWFDAGRSFGLRFYPIDEDIA